MNTQIDILKDLATLELAYITKHNPALEKNCNAVLSLIGAMQTEAAKTTAAVLNGWDSPEIGLEI